MACLSAAAVVSKGSVQTRKGRKVYSAQYLRREVSAPWWWCSAGDLYLKYATMVIPDWHSCDTEVQHLSREKLQSFLLQAGHLFRWISKPLELSVDSISRVSREFLVELGMPKAFGQHSLKMATVSWLFEEGRRWRKCRQRVNGDVLIQWPSIIIDGEGGRTSHQSLSLDRR